MRLFKFSWVKMKFREISCCGVVLMPQKKTFEICPWSNFFTTENPYDHSSEQVNRSLGRNNFMTVSS